MSDVADQANDLVTMNEERSIKYARTLAAKPIPEGTGICQWCKEKVIGTKRWCSAECRDNCELWGNA